MRRALSAALLALPALAAAQWSGSLIASTDDRTRGISASAGQPSLRATAAWDDPAGGWFGGVSLAPVRYGPGTRRAGVQAFGGIVRPLGGGLHGEAGLNLQHTLGNDRAGYDEVFVGLATDRLSLRLYASPDYAGSGAASLYAEVDVQHALAPAWRALLHVGALRRGDGAQGLRWDVRAGIALAAAGIDWQLAWVAVRRDGPFTPPPGTAARRWLASAAWSF